MMYATKNNERITAEPGSSGICPLCGGDVIPKCGDINIWHWAHKANLDCDDFKEHESPWHREWKSMFPEENRKVIVKKRGDIHIADVKMDHGLVIEFQNTSISFDKILEREKFYDDMIWIFNCRDALDRIEIIGGSLQWWNPRRDFSKCKKSVYLDIGDKLFEIESIVKDLDGKIQTWTIDGNFRTKDSLLTKVNRIPNGIKMFKCRFCKRRFVSHAVLDEIIYRIDDDCDGTVEDLEAI